VRQEDRRVGSREDRQAAEHAGDQRPATPVRRPPVLDRGGQGTQQQNGEQRLGHQRTADQDQRQIDRAERHRHQRDAPVEELRGEHADERHDRRAHERVGDAAGHDARRGLRPLDAAQRIDAGEEIRVARRPERRLPTRARADAREPVAGRDRARVNVVVVRVVNGLVARRRRDVPEPKGQGQGE